MTNGPNTTEKQLYDVTRDWSGLDLQTAAGRLRYFYAVCHPRQALVTDATVRQYSQDVREVLKTRTDGDGMARMTEAEFASYRMKRLLLASSTNPDTGDLIPWPMRISSFVPTNVPIIGGMIMAPPTQLWTIFWQWINQTYNAGLNYGNRNASSTQTNAELFQAYTIATGTALTVACSLRGACSLLIAGSSSPLAAFANYFIGYSAVASSSSANVVAMRYSETLSGISVSDEQTGESLGLSKVAAREAVQRTATSRVVYCVPMFFVPALWNIALAKVGLLPKKPGMARIIVEAAGVGLGLFIAMPVNCALYPQISRIEVARLEEEIQQKARARNLAYLAYNKGL